MSIDSSSASDPNIRTTATLLQGGMYSLPVISTTILMTPMWTALPGVYAKNFGLALSSIAWVMLIARLFDAVSDPIIGYLSDFYYDRKGSRKPFFIIGGVTVVASGYFLFLPPDNVSTTYFLICTLLFYFSFTLFEIPHMTYGGEISSVSNDKTMIYSLRNMAAYFGLVIFYAIPQLPLFDTTEITPDTLRWAVIISAFMMLPSLYMCINAIPNDVAVIANRAMQNNVKKHLVSALYSIISNRPFLIFVSGYIFFGLGVGMWYGLIFIYVDSYLQMGAEFSKIFMISFAISIFLIPVVYKFSIWIGKKRLWLTATITLILACLCTGLLQPSKTGFLELLVLKILTDFSYACLNIITPSILSDIVDDSTWQDGEGRSATYFSVYVFMGKAAAALGGALGLAIAGLYGFDPSLSENTEEAVFGLKISIIWIPSIILLCSLIFIVLMPNAKEKSSKNS